MPNTRPRDPHADEWIAEMERMREECVELVRSRFALVIRALDIGHEDEVFAVLFVADEERLGLPDALANLFAFTRHSAGAACLAEVGGYGA